LYLIDIIHHLLKKTTLYEVAGLGEFYDASLNRKNNVRKLTAAQDYFNFIYKLESSTLQALLDDVYYHSFAMIVLDTLEENEYSSLGARVTAMDNSTTNATKMIEVMNLLYNKARQASITNELIEIVSAANFV